MYKNLKTISMAALVAAALTFGGVSTANALTLTFDGSATSSNPEHTGASASVVMDFMSVTGGVQVDFTVSNTTGQIAPFGLEATSSQLISFLWDTSGASSSFDFEAGASLDNLLSTPSFPPFGTFELGASCGTDPLNCGPGGPSSGISQASSDEFSLSFVTLLSASDLEEAWEDGFSDGTLRAAVRFMAVYGGDNDANGGSDKLVLGNPTPVPVPAPLALFLTGLLGLGIIARRRKA